MSPSRLFILRPVATSLLMVAILLVGAVAYYQLPVSALPQVDYPTIQVLTFYPGASPDVVASATGHYHRRGPDMQPDADVVHDSGCLPVSRPRATLVYATPPGAQTASAARGITPGASWEWSCKKVWFPCDTCYYFPLRKSQTACTPGLRHRHTNRISMRRL